MDDNQDPNLNNTEEVLEAVEPTTAEVNDPENQTPVEENDDHVSASESEAGSQSEEEIASSSETPRNDEEQTEETAESESADGADERQDPQQSEGTAEETPLSEADQATQDDIQSLDSTDTNANPNARWYVVHTYSGHENKVATALKQRVESEHLEHKILDVIVPTQDKIEIRSGKKATVKEKIFPGYILVKMDLDDNSWLAVRTTQGVTGFVGIGNKPTPIPEAEVKTIVKFMTQGAAPTFKDVFMVDDTVKIIDGPFSEFIGKVDSVDKEHGKVRVLVSIFGRETPVELDFLQVQKL